MTISVENPRPLSADETGLTPQKVQTILRVIAGIGEETDSRVAQILLFGSRAKGTWREGSDIDLAITGTGITRGDVYRWVDRLEDELFPWSVDCALVDENAGEAFLAPIRRVGIVLYAQ